MQIDLVFIVMLIGHILGDFYFQTNEMVKNRKKCFSAVLKHSLVYFITITSTLMIGIPITLNSILLCISTGSFHFIIDTIKYLYQKNSSKFPSWIEKSLFILDQSLHFSALALCWAFWGNGLVVRWFVSQEMIHLPDLPVTMCLEILCILRPVGIFIADSILSNYKPFKYSLEFSGSDDTQNAGKIIGYLERVIVFILLLYQQFSAIAFVLTAKSVARFKEIEKNQASAEYFLIGTLMSVGSTLVISFLLGLCNTGT